MKTSSKMIPEIKSLLLVKPIETADLIYVLQAKAFAICITAIAANAIVIAFMCSGF